MKNALHHKSLDSTILYIKYDDWDQYNKDE